MKEESIVKLLITIIETKCIKSDIVEPRLVEVSIGMFNTYNRQMIISLFDELKKNSNIIKTTQIKLSKKPGKIKCNKCLKISEIEMFCDVSEVVCPKCNSINIETIEGEDINVEKISQ